MTFKLALIGAGRVGLRHAEAIEKIEQAQISAVVDIDKVRGKDLAAIHAATFFDDYRRLLESNLSLDAVINCLPHNLHYESTLLMAEQGLHVLLEKPMCMSLDEADELIASFKERRLKLAIGFVHRYRSELLEANDLIETGKLGKITLVTDNFYKYGGARIPAWVWDKKISGGGVLMFLGSHALDRMRWFVKAEPVQVFARTRAYVEGGDCEASVAATFEFANGATGLLMEHYSDYAMPHSWNTQVFGTEGMLEIEIGKHMRFSCDDMEFTRGKERYDNFERQMREFLASIEDDRNPWISGQEGRQSLAMALAVYRSAKEGQPIRLADL